MTSQTAANNNNGNISGSVDVETMVEVIFGELLKYL